ncbi:hypothetical protein PIB30_031983 [Stylosanthes scabra]|uniref:RINT1-like protein MAG2 n=1 Tax=Stylosanthes scabra TaxID=79078 RepID=A0ABU6UEQ1_9FABA|nr:hypothetical protein [Stylosanthes scabra]
MDSLPPPSHLSPSALSFLDRKFHTKDALAEASTLVAELQTQCSELDRSLNESTGRLGAGLLAYASFSGDVNDRLSALASTCSSSIVPDGGRGEEGDGKGFREELAALAKEVARLENVRVYAETALKLDTLIGDIEDAVSLAINKHLRKPSNQNSEEMHLVTINTLKTTEELLTSITKTQPQWKRLLSAADHRVDRALAILRPQAIADHRALLASHGWPPPLSSLTSTNQVLNPLLSMQADVRLKYSGNFLALCNLQELQRQRKARQLEGHDREVALRQPLWVIEELANPLSLASQRHFSKWVDKPEFIFTLVYKITSDYVDSIDEMLQPLIDEAKVVGYSCREEWISAMVTSLSTYLAKEIFPSYISQLEEESPTGIKSSARIWWLHLIDLMIAFDKRIKSLVERSGILLSFDDNGMLQRISSLSVFCDRPDWLDLWAEIELGDALDKLKPHIEDENYWIKKVEGVVLSSVTDDLKSPLISSAFLRHLSAVIERCRSLPSVTLRSKFLRLAGVPIIRKFFDSVLVRCQEAEGLTALTDDDAVIKVAVSINAAHYFESVLRECVKFHNDGVERFSSDMGVLFGVFGTWCLRPQGFLPKSSEGLKLLKLNENRVEECIAGRKRWLKENGIRHLTVTDAEKVVKNRVFTS